MVKSKTYTYSLLSNFEEGVDSNPGSSPSRKLQNSSSHSQTSLFNCCSFLRQKSLVWILLYFLFLLTFLYIAIIVEFSLFKFQNQVHVNYNYLSEKSKQVYDSYFSKPNETEKHSSSRGFKWAEKITCQLPQLEPFDDSVKTFIKKPPDLKCTNDTSKYNKINYTFPIIFETDLDSTLFTLQDPKIYGLEKCCYKSFTRKKENDVTYSKTCYPITKNQTLIPPDHEFIAVYCLNTTDTKGSKVRKYILIDMFNFVQLKPEVEKRLLPSENSEKLNVVILGIDAVSHMNFMRTMPQTHAYLTEKLNAISMNGYTKVGDNTFPNIVPALAGLSVHELIPTYLNSTKSSYFDDLPFIWKNYSDAGYRTSYAEDACWMGIFNYMKKGFKNEPTDYYLNTLTYTQDSQIGHYKPLNANFCYGPRLGFSVLLKNLRKIAFKMETNKKPYFHFTWATSLSHDYLETPGLGDADLFSTLKWFNDTGYLKNTVFILMSDHGIRYGKIRETYQGKIEERMPFLYFLLPESQFTEKYRSASSNLKMNQNRLTSPFDFYETLKDLLDPENNLRDENIRERHIQLQGSQNLPPQRGISLFLPIPTKRTCEDGEISSHYCVCHSMTSISPTDPEVVLATEAAINYLNAKLKPFYQCSKLNLKVIRNAQIEQMRTNNTEVFDKATLSQMDKKYSVIFVTEPSDAVFEATLIKSHSKSKSIAEDYSVSGDISRLNLYGNQSRCVLDYEMKKYCFCS